VGTPGSVAAGQVHGYTVGFIFGSVALALAAVVAVLFVTARKDQLAATEVAAVTG
jgi:hypothetical protein